MEVLREEQGFSEKDFEGYDSRAANGEPHPVTGSRVVLTVAHLDHDETSSDPANLRTMCQRCHLTYDARHHAANAAATRRRRAA